jgi:hypothetical protein
MTLALFIFNNFFCKIYKFKKKKKKKKKTAAATIENYILSNPPK